MCRFLNGIVVRVAGGAVCPALLTIVGLLATAAIWPPLELEAQRAAGTRPATTSPDVRALAALPATPLEPFFSATGKLRLSTDGLGRLDGAGGVIQVEKRAGATVRAAFLLAASTGFSGYEPLNGDVTIDGTPVNWDPTRTINNSIFSVNVLADVTSLVKDKIDAAPAGRVDFLVAEPVNSLRIDGEILAVVLDDPNELTNTTITLLYGAQQVGGDTFAIGLSEPIDKSDPNLAIRFALGISFGAQPNPQFSRVDVNNQRLTTSAGGQDDLDGPVGNGALLTVGGLDDSTANPPDPQLQGCPQNPPFCDDELYDLVPFVNDGDSAIVVFTQNPSTDDNIFFASFELTSVGAVVGEGITLAPAFGRNLVGTPHTVVATVQDASGRPRSDVEVTFDVIQGPSAGITGTAQTSVNGTADFQYAADRPGVDAIVARFTSSRGEVVTSNAAIKLWEPVRTVGETCDGLDNDGDGIVDEGFPDTDRDGIANCVDDDEDNDGVPDGIDNCPTVFNPDQIDSDRDGIGDACDTDRVVVNPRSPVEIETDGQFGPPTDEWKAITPGSFLNGESFVYSAVEGQDIYLMYDYRKNSRPLEPGDTIGPISFQIGGGSFFDVFVTQGGENTNFDPDPPESRGGIGDTVRVFLNGVLFDNSAGCVSGAVDYNSTSPNFPEAHTLVELEVRLTGFPGGCYSHEPAFWSATLPTVRATPAAAEPSAAAEVETENILVASAFFRITDTGDTEVSPLALPADDSVPPAITVPADITVEATSASGALVSYTASAIDDVDGDVPVECRPPSGGAFALGTTIVTCQASDSAGNTAEATFAVHVRDTTPPALTLPSPLRLDATSPKGTAVIYVATAADIVDGSVPVLCKPASGAVFAINRQGQSTTVACSATDRAGNVATGSFIVHVKGAVEQIRDLDKLVASLSISRRHQILLRTKLAIALIALSANSSHVACGALRSFSDEVKKLSGRGLKPSQATVIRGQVTRIRAVIGCR